MSGTRHRIAAKAEVALLRAHGYTWRELAEWRGVSRHAAYQQAQRGAPYAALCLIALRNAAQEPHATRLTTNAAWGFRGRTYQDRVMELVHRAHAKHFKPPKPQQPRDPADLLAWLEQTGRGDTGLADAIRQDLNL